jgi:starvation-inducible DNA-binding protein
MAALDMVYKGIIEDTRKNIARLKDLDLVTQDLLIAHTTELEKFQWVIRAHLEDSRGSLASEGATTEKAAARSAVDAAKRR